MVELWQFSADELLAEDLLVSFFVLLRVIVVVMFGLHFLCRWRLL